ncbi:MAG: ornithine cyclodeaminase family protein [bacterium]|nr:ornithine cyclodeaminase family protein [bacterium]
MKLRVLSSSDLRQALPMKDTIEAMKGAFEAFSSGRATVPQRMSIPVPPDDSVMLVKPASIPGEGLGAKLVSVFPPNAKVGRQVVSGIVVLLDPSTGEPIALCDGTFLTAWRTGAATGAATDLLAREDSKVGAMIGCGEQGRTQVIAIDTVRDLDIIRLYDLDPEAIDAFVREIQPEVQARLEPALSPQEAVTDADIVCVATTSKRPVLDGDWVGSGTHINGVGSFTPEMKEVDGNTISRAVVVVDSREAALAEAGELIDAVAEDLSRSQDWIELGEIVAGKVGGRKDDEQITFFKSVGLAVQDIAAGALAMQRATELGIGVELDW